MQLANVLIAAILTLSFFAGIPSRAADYFQAVGVIDTRTSFSDGAYDPLALAHLAAKKGLDVLVFNDHDRMVLEYGVPPFRNILKKKVELNSINKTGAAEYLKAIYRASRQIENLIVIPGSETAPFYYWQGSLFSRNLTAHDHEKRLLTIGMEAPRDYLDLPILHNGYTRRYIKNFLPAMILLSGSFLLGLLLLREKRFYRLAGIFISLLSLLYLVNLKPFRSSPYDAYHGSQGIAPYQLVIDYVNARNGMTFWNYPETRSGIRKMGPIYVNTPPYPEVLEDAVNYTGFAAIYGDTISLTEPGKQWDRVLSAYCKGERKRPVWGIATADFHKEGDGKQQLGDFPTVFLVSAKSQKEILSAMRQGRMYACGAKYPQRIVLEDFSVCAGSCRQHAVMGEEIQLESPPKIHIALALKQPAANRVNIRLIRSGRLIRTFSGSLPMEIEVVDTDVRPGEKNYYRIDVSGHGKLVSNPIFFTLK